MATTTTNYGFDIPQSTDLVKDGATAIATLGQDVDTQLKALNPSTTLGDIEYRSSTANTNTRLAIGTTGQVLTVAAGVPSWATPAAGSTFAGCRAVNNANQSISNETATAVSFQTESFDSDAFHNNSTNNSRLTIPSGKTGYYQVSALLKWQNDPTTGSIRQFRTYLNGSQTNVYTMVWTQNNDQTQVYGDLLSLTQGDYIEIYVWHNDGSSTNLLADSSFALVKVG